MNNRFGLQGKVAFVTGCGTGIGRAIAIDLAQAGADIAGVYFHSSPQETSEAVVASGRRFYGVKADLRRRESVEEILSFVCGAYGRIDIMVNNAGLARRSKVLDVSEQDWDEVMAVNLRALFLLCQAAARQFIDQGGGGRIINIASVLAYRDGVLLPSYVAAKAAVLGITRSLAGELAPKGINVNAIAPGYVRSEFTRSLWEDAERERMILSRIPAGRWGRPEDVAGAALFLSSQMSEYVTGTCITVDGGWMAL